jgi:hypothetical protein
MRTKLPVKQDKRRETDLAPGATAGCRPIAMPQAKAATIATAGILMKSFAT